MSLQDDLTRFWKRTIVFDPHIEHRNFELWNGSSPLSPRRHLGGPRQRTQGLPRLHSTLGYRSPNEAEQLDT